MWVLLLKAHRAAGKLTGAAFIALSVAAAARRRVAAGRTDAGAAPPRESPALRTKFYGFLLGGQELRRRRGLHLLPPWAQAPRPDGARRSRQARSPEVRPAAAAGATGGREKWDPHCNIPVFITIKGEC